MRTLQSSNARLAMLLMAVSLGLLTYGTWRAGTYAAAKTFSTANPDGSAINHLHLPKASALMFASSAIPLQQLSCELVCPSGSGTMTKIEWAGGVNAATGNVFLSGSPKFVFRLGYIPGPDVLLTPIPPRPGDPRHIYRFDLLASGCVRYSGVTLGFPEPSGGIGNLTVDLVVDNFDNRRVLEIAYFYLDDVHEHSVTYANRLDDLRLPSTPDLPTETILDATKWGFIEFRSAFAAPGSSLTGIPTDAKGVFTAQTCPVTPTCQPITATLSGGATIQSGGSATLTVTLTGGSVPYTVTLNNNGGTLTSASPLQFTLSPAATTTYTISSATDVNGCPATASGSAIVTVTADTTPPTLTCPGNQVGVISGTSGPVTYTPPTASDNQPGATFTCTLPSGVNFAPGVTTVNCTARDAAGNSAACSFIVTVRQPRPAIKDLINKVKALVPPLTPAQANGLIGHLEMANTNIERGQTAQACTHLQNFVNGVSTLISGGQLTAAQGQSLTSYANQIRNAVGCAGHPFPI